MITPTQKVVSGYGFQKNITYRARLAVDSFLQFHNRAKIKTENDDEKFLANFFFSVLEYFFGTP